ncbi:serine/threonine-protein phosphatase 7 long form-like [Quillaja saponaria]|uniref:Serine/threonine-protein phosphatase 7 long form-like n=1 Tax=Quillaja saponaria TaxID=32244 RepID=A0AAD7PW74_QUISA|nr:serine/threonine-protein phosphatase 7 long form-like [Quillaja saponaria]
MEEIGIMCYINGEMRTGSNGLEYDSGPVKCIRVPKLSREASASLRLHSPINYSEAPGEDIGDGQYIPDLNVDPHFNIEVDDNDIIEAPEKDLFFEYVPNLFYTDVNIARACAVNPVIVPNAQWELHNEFYNGMLFSTKAELKNTIKYWHIMNHVAFIVIESKNDTWDIRFMDPVTPVDVSVLRLHDSHRSVRVFTDHESEAHVLRCRRREAVFGQEILNNINNINPRVLEYMTMAVERWRPETHTFRLPHSEATITLQDVSILFGLPVDGEPVSGLVGADVATECKRLLGLMPPTTAVKGNTLKMSWLGLTFQNFPADGDDITAQRYARAYILQLMGGLLFTSKTSTHVHICFLSLLENLYVVGQYSWGSVSLAWLYREMCHATHLDASEITRPLILLQVWAWERLPFLVPRRETDIPWDNLCPLGVRWRVKFKVTQIGHNVVSWYREMLDRMSADQLLPILLIRYHRHHCHHNVADAVELMSLDRRISYGRVDADVRLSDVYIPSPAHMSPPPYMASSSSMYHQLMPGLCTAIKRGF